MSPYTFRQNVRLTDGKICEMQFTAVPCHHRFVYLGVQQLIVSGDINYLPFVADWISVKQEAENAADEHFKSIASRVVA